MYNFQIFCSVSRRLAAAILDITFESIPANIAKLLNHLQNKIFFPSPSPSSMYVVNNAETTFGNIP